VDRGACRKPFPQGVLRQRAAAQTVHFTTDEQRGSRPKPRQNGPIFDPKTAVWRAKTAFLGPITGRFQRAIYRRKPLSDKGFHAKTCVSSEIAAGKIPQV
jgi:hypothetical protein